MQQQTQHPQRRLLLRIYQAMTLPELATHKIQIVAELHQLNQLVTQLIQNASNTVVKAQTIDAQISTQKKLQNSLIKSLENFEFMLSGDYSVMLEEELVKTKRKVKTAKNQVNRLTRELSAPMESDIVACQDLQAAVVKLGAEIEEGRIKVSEKVKKLKQVVRENNYKAAQIHKLNTAISKLTETLEREEADEGSKYLVDPLKYQKLAIKKEKLKRGIESLNKKWDHQLRQKRNQLQEIDNLQTDLCECLKQIQIAIQEREQEVGTLKIRSKASKPKTNRIRMYSEGSQKINGNKLPRQADFHTTFIVERERKASRIREIALRSKGKTQNNKAEGKQEKLLPSIYQILGKEKALIQEDEDLAELVYQ